MKNFSKLVFTALFVFAIAPAFAQFSAGVDVGIPNGDWSNFEGLGLGLSLKYEAPIQDKLNWTASGGFLSFSGKTYQGFKANNITAVPFTGGVKYYFQKANDGFYASGDLGVYFFSGNGNSTNRVGFSPGIGYRVNQFDLSFKLNLVSDFNYVGLRAAYVFNK